MKPRAALAQARHEFESRLAQVTDDQCELATPCEEWNVRDLVNHVMLGNRMTVDLLAGADGHDLIAGFGDDLIGAADDVRTAFAALADQVAEGFGADDALDGTVNHPGGVFPRTVFIGFRVADYACHAWDLARAIGADEQLDADLVQFLWDDAQPMAGSLAETGMFGDSASGTVPADAPLQTRYLDLMGRRP